MDLKRLRYFCTVMEQGNITRAAEVLNMAQPPLSKRLQELEEELGVKLFLRQGRRLEPTSAGYYLYEKAGGILRQVEQVALDTQQFSLRGKRVIRLGLTHLFQRYFSPLLLALRQRIPHAEWQIQVSDSSHLETLLGHNLLDFALIQRPAKLESYTCITLPPVHLTAVVHRALLPDGDTRTALSFSELGELPLIMLKRASGAGTMEYLMNQLRKSGVQPDVLMYISQPELILNWLEGGLEAAALLPASEIRAEQLNHSRCFDILPSQQVFYPAIVKLTATPPLHELVSLIEQGYPFSDPL